MAFLIVVSTSGVAISKHLCNGEVKDIAVFHKAESCDHVGKSVTMNCPIHEGMVIQVNDDGNNCCSDTIELLKDDQPQIDVKPFEMPFLQWVFLPLILYLEINPSLLVVTELKDQHLHLPPLINQEIPILLQSFLL